MRKNYFREAMRYECACAGPQQLAVNVQRPGLQQYPGGGSSQGLSGAGRRMLASPERTLDVSIMPQPGQVWVLSPLPGYLQVVQAPGPSLQRSEGHAWSCSRTWRP